MDLSAGLLLLVSSPLYERHWQVLSHELTDKHWKAAATHYFFSVADSRMRAIKGRSCFLRLTMPFSS